MITETPYSAVLFTQTVPQTAQLESLSNRAITRGLDLFIEKKYDEAIVEFQRAVGLAPVSEGAVEAYKYIAQSYTQKNDNAGAIKAYQDALKLDPTNSEIYAALGKIHYFEKDYDESVKQYEQASRWDPSAANRFSLGQAYLADGSYADAEYEFRQVRTLEPDEPSGDYGLGLVQAKQGRSEEALKSFQRALDIDRSFLDAYAEMGFIYADTGRMDDAKQVLADLEKAESTLAVTLNAYLYQKTPPKMLTAYSDSSFPSTMGPGTLVAALSSYLSTADSSLNFSMVFQFSKEMDPAEVENVLNWDIGRSIGTGLGDSYNYGLSIPGTEASVAPHPVSVYYDQTAHTATLWFNLQQNATADATIDPSHLQFTFTGDDKFGQTMDPTADQYMGFSGFA